MSSIESLDERVKRVEKPIKQEKQVSLFSINESLSQIEKQEDTAEEEDTEENLPDGHFSDIDVNNEWQVFIKKLARENSVVFYAVQDFILNKTAEHEITVKYGSQSAKAEFEKVSKDFFSHFKHKYKNDRLKVVYEKNEHLLNNTSTLLNKKEIFNKMLEINPLLKDLNEIMKFNFN